jgi:hypothetical protein
MEMCKKLMAQTYAYKRGTSKNLALLVFRVPDFIFLPEGRGFINKLHVVFRNPFLQTSFPLGF